MMEPPSLRDDGRGACLSLFDVPLVCLPWVESAADKHILALLVTVAVGVLLAVRFCHVIFDVDAPSLEVGRIREFSIVTLNSSARIVSFNAGSEILYGRSAEMVIGRQANVLYDMDDYDAMEMAAADFDTARRTGSVERILKVRKRRSSSVSNSGAPSDSRSSSTSSRTGEVADARRYVFANVIITAHRGGQGGFTLVGWDISRHVEAEEALRQSEERFRLLVGSVKDYAIFMLDVDGNIVSWNAGAQNIKQYKADEIVGRNFRTFYPQCDIDSGKPEMELREAKRVGRFEDFGWRLRKDGTQFWANVVITAVHNAAGELCGFAKVTRDITDRKLLEAAIIEKEAAESADRAKSQFLAMISHEIRTPMYGIIGCAELLASTALTDEQAEYVNTITKCGDGLLRLINDVLELSRVNAQQIVIENVAIDVPTICKEVVSIVETQAASRGIELVLSIPRRLPCIVNDPARLRQVLVNFVGNAVKFGNRRVVVSATETADGKAIRVEVTDDGIGIAPEDQQKLFHMFSQVDSSSTRAFGGTGLGLAICKRFTELMGGRIGVISDVGKGSTFWIELALPLDRFFFPSEFYAAVSSSIAQTKESQRAAVGAPSEQPAPAAPAAEFVFNPVPLAGDNTPQGTPPVTPRSGARDAQRPEVDGVVEVMRSTEGPRVLLVQDQRSRGSLVGANLLERLGCVVSRALTSNEAARMVQDAMEHAVAYDAALIDISNADGAAEGLLSASDAIAKMASLPFGRRPTLLAMTTGSPTPADRDRCLQLGMDDLISRPVTMAEARYVLSQHIRLPADKATVSRSPSPTEQR